MTHLPIEPPGLARWPWRTAAWTIAVAVAIDCASVAVERFMPRPEVPGPNLTNWNGPRLTPAEMLDMQVGFYVVINLAFLATTLGIHQVISRIRRGKSWAGTAVLALALLLPALIGVGGNVALIMSMIFR